MKNIDMAAFERTAFNYNTSFKDKKRIAELQNEVEALKKEIAELKQVDNSDVDDVKVISTVDDFIFLIREQLDGVDIVSLITGLNQAVKKQQGSVKNQGDDFDKTEYVVKRIFKTRPSKKVALINTIKTMFQDGITESEIEEIILDLQKRSFIKIIDNKITYL